MHCSLPGCSPCFPPLLQLFPISFPGVQVPSSPRPLLLSGCPCLSHLTMSSITPNLSLHTGLPSRTAHTTSMSLRQLRLSLVGWDSPSPLSPLLDPPSDVPSGRRAFPYSFMLWGTSWNLLYPRLQVRSVCLICLHITWIYPPSSSSATNLSRPPPSSPTWETAATALPAPSPCPLLSSSNPFSRAAARVSF